MRQRERRSRSIKEKALLQGVGRQLAVRRQARQLTQEALAEKAGLGLKYVSEVECGKTNPTLLTLWQLSQALDVELEEMCGGAPTDKEEERRLHTQLGRFLQNCQGQARERTVALLTILLSSDGEKH